MKILPPHRISSEIIDIVYEAKQQLVLVSPYIDLFNWNRLSAELSNALRRGVNIDCFVRFEAENAKSWEQISEIGIKPRLIKNLHAKFYYNENSGLISSMNLLSSSNSNSIEIGCKIDKEEEIEQLKRFVNDFVIINESLEMPTEDDLYLMKEKFTVVLQNYIGNALNSSTSIYYKNGSFLLNTLGNRFYINIDKVNNNVILSGVISGKEADIGETHMSKYFSSGYFNYRVDRGGNGYYNMLEASSNVRLSNSYLDNLRINEKKELIVEITNFLDCFKKFKKDCWESYK